MVRENSQLKKELQAIQLAKSVNKLICIKILNS